MRVRSFCVLGVAAALGCSYDASQLAGPPTTSPDSAALGNPSNADASGNGGGAGGVPRIDAPTSSGGAGGTTRVLSAGGAVFLYDAADRLDVLAMGADDSLGTGGSAILGSGGRVSSVVSDASSTGGTIGVGGMSDARADGTAAGTGEAVDSSSTDSLPDAYLTAPDLSLPEDPPGTSTTVTFANGLGVGVVSGYGWVAMGTDDTVSSPTCGAGHLPISGASPCDASTIWDKSNALCATGSVPALPTPTTSANYAAYWGLQIGVNVSPTSGPIGVAYRTITVNLTGSPTSGLRIELHRYGDPAGSNYCASLPVPAAPVPLTSFNTSCWDNSGTFFTTADAPNIDQISVQVTAGSSAITVDELCLDSIVLSY